MRPTILIWTLGALAWGSLPGGGNAAEWACKGDKEKFCAKADASDSGAVLKCLMGRKDDLADACRDIVVHKAKEIEDKRAAFDKACGDDAGKLCKDVNPGGGRIAACLQKKADSLQEGCRSFLGRKDHADLEDAWRDACGPDALKVCKDVPPGGGKVLACMRKRRGDLSAACAKLMDSDDVKGETEDFLLPSQAETDPTEKGEDAKAAQD